MIKFQLIVTVNLLCCFSFYQCQVTPRQILPSLASAQQTVDYKYVSESVDARSLKEAITGLGTSEDVIINVLTNRTNEQRQNMIKAYKEMFNKDLVTDLKNDISGHFKKVVESLMLKPYDYLAKELHKALTSVFSDTDAIDEILCTKSKTDLLGIIDSYQNQYNKELKEAIEENLEGDVKVFYKHLLTGQLRERATLNLFKVSDQLLSIPNANNSCTIKENGLLMNFLGKESFDQIAAVEMAHEKLRNKTIDQQIKQWCTQDSALRNAYLTIARYVDDPPKYFAEELQRAMIGLGTDDDKLIRIIVSRSEIDLFNIKNRYESTYNKPLTASVEAETSGYYQKILVRLIETSDFTGVSRNHYG